MNRPRKHDRHLPACMYHKHGAYYLVRRGKWRRLATKLPDALREYARLIDQPRGVGGMPALIDTMLPRILRNARTGRPHADAVTQAMYEAADRELWMGGVRDVSEGVVRNAIAAALAVRAQAPLTDEEIVDMVRAAGLDWHAGFPVGGDESNRYATLCRAVEQRVRDALAVRAVPAGWRLVPVTPTGAMLRVGRCMALDGRSAFDVYRAMLDAAPPAPEREGETR